MNGSNLSRCAISYCVAATLLAGCGGSQQSVGVPATNAVAPAQVPARRPTKAEWERWSSMIQRVPDPGHGCLVARYPERQWREITCGKAPDVPLLPAYVRPPGVRPPRVGGGGQEYFADPIGGHTTAAQGWFHNIAGVKSEYSVGTTSHATDYYSLQVNTNAFKTPVCADYGGPNPNCEGWEQFVFTNQGDTSDGSLFIQYWLINYGPCGSSTCTDDCPSGWQGVKGLGKNEMSCFRNSNNADDVQSEPIVFGLTNFRISGASAERSSTSDYVTLSVTGSGFYKVYGDNLFPNLSAHWLSTEFGVFGDYNGNEAIFNTGSTIGVRLAVTTVNGTTEKPVCSPNQKYGGIVTAESNNLSMAKTSSKWPIKNWPAIIFTESTNGKNANCATVPGM
jgi:hypothetical protein